MSLRNIPNSPFVNPAAVLPPNIQFEDPSRYTYPELKALARHWLAQASSDFMRWSTVYRKGNTVTEGLYPDEEINMRSSAKKPRGGGKQPAQVSGHCEINPALLTHSDSAVARVKLKAEEASAYVSLKTVTMTQTAEST